MEIKEDICYLFTQPLRHLSGLKTIDLYSDFSYSSTGCVTKAKELRVFYS